MAVSEDLELNIAPAVQSVEELGQTIESTLTSAFAAVGQSVQDVFATLGDTIEIDPDVSGVADAITQAIDAADTEFPLEPTGTETIPADIENAIAQADNGVPLVADGDIITEAIETGIEQADKNVVVTPEFDSEAAAEGIGSLGQAADEAGDSLDSTAEGLQSVQGASQLAQGDIAGVVATLGAVTARGSAAAGALLAIAGATTVMFRAASEAASSQRRFNEVFGTFASSIDQVNIGGLNEDLSQLALSLGADDDAIRATAASLGRLAQASGASQRAAASFAEQIVVLAARATAANPALGNVEDVADGMARALARGGPFAAQFGISLSAAQIQARALADTGKATNAELTFFERAAAGAALASERFGDSTAKIVAKGVDDPVIRLRSLRQSVQEFLEAAGAPLVAPGLDLLRAALPVVRETGEVFGDLASSALPAATEALQGLLPIFQSIGAAAGGVASVVGLIPSSITGAALSFAVLQRLTVPLADALAGLAVSAGNLGLAGALTGLPTVLGIVGGAFTIFQGIMARSRQRAEEHKRAVLDLRDAIIADTKAIEDNNQAEATNVRNKIQSRLETKNQIDDLARTRTTLDEVQAAVIGSDRAFLDFLNTIARTGAFGEDARDGFDTMREAQLAQDKQTLNGVKSNNGLFKSLVGLHGEYRESARAVRDLETIQRRNQETSRAFSVSLDAVKKAFEGLRGVVPSTEAVVAALLRRLSSGQLTLRDFATASEGASKKTKDALGLIAQALGQAQDELADQFTSKIPSAAQATADALDVATQREADAVRAFAETVGLAPDAIGAALEEAKGKFNLDDVIADLNRQANDIRAFFLRVEQIAADGLDATAEHLLELGPVQGAALARQVQEAGLQQRLLVENSSREIERAGQFGIDAVIRIIQRVPALAAQLGRLTTEELKKTLKIGNATEEEVARVLAALDSAAGDQGAQAKARKIGEGIGGAFGEGVRQGMIGIHEAIRGEAEELVHVAEKQMIKTSGARSPARLFMPIGKSFAEGIAQGIADGASLIAKEAEAIVMQAAEIQLPTVNVPVAPASGATSPSARVPTEVSTAVSGGDTFTINAYYPTPEPISDLAPRALKRAQYTLGTVRNTNN